MKHSMVRHGLTRYLLVIVACSALLPAQTKRVEKAVLEKENAWNTAFMHGDHAAIDSMLDQDYLITEEDGKVYDKKQYIELISDPSLHVAISEFSDLRVRVHGRTAIVTGQYHVKGTQKGSSFEMLDRFTDVWQRSSNGWRLIGSQYSLLPQAGQSESLQLQH